MKQWNKMTSGICAAVVIAVIKFVILGSSSSSSSLFHQPPPAEATGIVKAVQVRVLKVVDGDTIHVNLNSTEERVRLIGVDTPETKHPQKGVEPFGPEASEYTKETLGRKMVWIEFDVGQRDRYGRLLAYVWLEMPESGTDEEIRAKMFNARLLLNGYARLMTIPPNVKYVDRFKEYQTEARENQKGLWSDAN